MKRVNLDEAQAQAFAEAAKERGLVPDEATIELAATIATAYPALRAQITTRPDDVFAIQKSNPRMARDLKTYRRLAATQITDVRSDIRKFVQRERMRIAYRELRAEYGDIDVTARELADLAQVCLEIAVGEAERWAEERFGRPLASTGERCAFTVLGMGKLGGRELNAGSDVDLVMFYETDDGEVVKDGVSTDQTLHEHFMRITQRFTATLEDVTDDGLAWRVDLRLRPEGTRGPLVNALAAAERYYETWGRTWERAALLRARPVAGDLAFGDQVLEALAPFVWRKAVDPKIAAEMAEMVTLARTQLATEPDRDLKLGPGGIREVEFFVQSLQLIWGGKEPRVRTQNTLEAIRRLRARGLVNEREVREVETAYLTLRRLEHRVQNATGIQTHVLPRGELEETIAKSLGFTSAHELEKDLDKIRRRVAARFASLTEKQPEMDYAPIHAAIDSGEESLVLTALAESPDFAGIAITPDLARHLLTLARRPDFPLGVSSRDRHPGLARTFLEAVAGAADPEQAARLLGSFFARLSTPGVYVRAMAGDPNVLRKLVGLFGASAFLGESLIAHPELAENLLFTRGLITETRAKRELEDEIGSQANDPEGDPDDQLVGALRHAKGRLVMEVGLAELSGELAPREATQVLTAIADATLEHATRRALAWKGLDSGLAVIAMGKLGGREIGYGSDLDIFFVYDNENEELSEKYVRAAQRVLSLVSTPHGAGPGYELDTRLRPSGSHGLLVVSIDAFARYHESGGGHDWERQALVKARPCAGDQELGRKVGVLAATFAYERGAPDPIHMHRLRLRMETELARESSSRFDLKLGRGGLVDVEFAVQWLQMKYGADPRVRTTDTETALGALEAVGYVDASHAAILREGYVFLRRLEQALRVVHGTSASLIEEGAPGLTVLARRMGFRDMAGRSASEALLERYRAVTRDVRAAFLTVLGVSATARESAFPSA